MKTVYIRVLRVLRGVLTRLGVVALLERRAPRSRTATWLLSLLAIHDVDALVRLDVAWWTFDSLDRVQAFLAVHRPGRAARVFEWGSGASTLWLAERAGEVHSVEHDAGWAQVLAPRLPGNVDLRVVAPVPSSSPRVPSAKPGHAGLDFSAYVSAIDDVEGELDLVVIDGRAREACLARALERLAPDGLVVFDNVDRRRYVEAIDAQVAASGGRLQVVVSRGLTPALPYPTRTALLRLSRAGSRTA